MTRNTGAVTVTESPLIVRENTVTQALESSIDERTMAGMTDGRFSNMLQRGSVLTGPALLAPRDRYAGSAMDGAANAVNNFITVNEHGRMTNEPGVLD